MKVLFSVLKYKLVTNESINIGILFHNLDTDERRLETISKWSRLKNFDDEINMILFKILLNGIKDEVKDSLFNETLHFNISEYTKKFRNEMRFSKIYEEHTDNFDSFVEFNKKIFLRYDYDQKDRPKKDQQIKYMKTLMKSNEIPYSVKKIMGEHQESIQYDYIIDNFAFKFFEFENKKLDRLVSSAKAWAYTAKELSDIYNTIFVYDVDVDDRKFNIIIDILKKSAYDIIKYDNTIDYMSNKNDLTDINF